MHPLIGPKANPPIIAGKSDICISKNDGNINGKLNLQNAYKINEIAVSNAIFAIYAVDIFFITSPMDKKKSPWDVTSSIQTILSVWEFHPINRKCGSRTLTVGEDFHLAPKQYKHITANAYCQQN